MLAPVLTTQTRDGLAVTLRPHTAEDAPHVVTMMSDPLTTQWLEPLPNPYLLEHALGFIASRELCWLDPAAADELTLVVDVDGATVGQVGYRPRNGTGEIGYVMIRAWEGRGIMTAAVRRFVSWVLAVDGLDRRSVVWRARRGNWASRRVAWAAGFSFDGIGRGHTTADDGSPVDLWLGSVLRGEPLLPRHPWPQTPRITIGEHLLRAADEHDVERIVEACSDPEISDRLPQLPVPYTHQDAAAYLQAVAEEQALGTALVWAVAGGQDPDRLLGMVALSGIRPRVPFCEIGYWVHPDARRRSAATVGCRGAVRHALLPVEEGGLGLSAVLLRAGRDNLASQRVAESAGFTRTGTDPAGELRRDGSIGGFIRYHFTVDELEAAWAHPASLR